MLDAGADLWDALDPLVQSSALAVAILAPLAVIWVLLSRGFAPGALARALLRRYALVNAVFVVLIAVSVGMSIGLIAQERGLREGSARAASKFEIIVAAPGSELTMLFSAVYLDPTNVALLDGEVFDAVVRHPRVEIAAPIAFGDSYLGDPVVGTTEAFVTHLGDGEIEGRMFATPFEGVAGAALPHALGHVFTPAHGLGDDAEEGLHDDQITIVGRLPVTGSPWDRAILVPVESVWITHAMGDGRGGDGSVLGPPYDPAFFPGTPAILVQTGNLPAAYAVQAEFNSRDDAMAFFPGAVLAELYAVMGDVRRAMQVMATVTQILVAASVLTGLFILTRLYRPQLQLLRTLGAPGRFLVAVVWRQAVTLLALGTVLGLALGVGAAAILSRIVSAEIGIAVTARLGAAELLLAAWFLTLSAILAVVLGLGAARSARHGTVRD